MVGEDHLSITAKRLFPNGVRFIEVPLYNVFYITYLRVRKEEYDFYYMLVTLTTGYNTRYNLIIISW